MTIDIVYRCSMETKKPRGECGTSTRVERKWEEFAHGTTHICRVISADLLYEVLASLPRDTLDTCELVSRSWTHLIRVASTRLAIRRLTSLRVVSDHSHHSLTVHHVLT